MKLVVSLNEFGLASTTPPRRLPLDPADPEGELETEDAALARELAARPGSEPLSEALVRALRAADTPPLGAVIPVAEFKRRIVPARLALRSKPADVREQWLDIIGILTDFSTVDLRDPNLPPLVAAAADDGLLTPEQAAAVLAYGDSP